MCTVYKYYVLCALYCGITKYEHKIWYNMVYRNLDILELKKNCITLQSW